MDYSVIGFYKRDANIIIPRDDLSVKLIFVLKINLLFEKEEEITNVRFLILRSNFYLLYMNKFFYLSNFYK